MNLNSNAVGLSARQRINFDFNNFLWALVILLVIILSSVVSANGQLKESKKTPPKSTNEPKVDIKVNRHYDNKRNIIGYDSTYSSFYSSKPGDTIGMHDMMKNFDRQFKSIQPSYFDRHFDKMFPNDTARLHDLFRDDLFYHNFLLNHETWHGFFDDMTHRLDSIKNKFFREGDKDLQKH